MEEKEYIYPFNYRHFKVCTVAMYGQKKPLVVNGHLVMKIYYKDQNKTDIDHRRTSEFTMDEVFFETNKVIRELFGDAYNGRRELIELSMPELGKEYRIVYNGAEIPSPRYDDQIRVLAQRDPAARGVAIILKRDSSKGIQWLDEEEAEQIAKKLAE